MNCRNVSQRRSVTCIWAQTQTACFSFSRSCLQVSYFVWFQKMFENIYIQGIRPNEHIFKCVAAIIPSLAIIFSLNFVYWMMSAYQFDFSATYCTLAGLPTQNFYLAAVPAMSWIVFDIFLIGLFVHKLLILARWITTCTTNEKKNAGRIQTIHNIIKVCARLTWLALITSISSVAMLFVAYYDNVSLAVLIDYMINGICLLLTFSFHESLFDNVCCCFKCCFNCFEYFVK